MGSAAQPSVVNVQLATEASNVRFEVAQGPRVYQVLLPNPKPFYLLTVTISAPTFAGRGVIVTGAEVHPLHDGVFIPWWILTSAMLLAQHALLYTLLTRHLPQLLRLLVLSLWLPLLLPWLWTHGYDSRGTVVLGTAIIGGMIPFTIVRFSTFVTRLPVVRNGWQQIQSYHQALYTTTLLLPLVVYGLIAWHWNSGSVITMTGDEPHYILIAASLARDHDLALENNYHQDAIDHQFSTHMLDSEAHTIQDSHGWFSVHGIGIPILLVLPLSVAGVLGAKVTLAALIGLFPLVVFTVMRRVLESQPDALLVTLAVGLGLPFLAASNQIYPDMLTGVLVFTIAVFLLFGTPESSLRYWRTTWLVALLIAYLPWLHIKNVAPMLLLTLWYCCTHLRAPFRLRWAPPLSLVVISLLVFGIYNAYIYGNISGPYSAPLIYDLHQFMMILLGLHLDQSQGMFIQQPLLLLALLGIAPFWRSHRLGAVFIALIYFSLIMPNAMFPNWYGGLSFSGRFAWSSVLLWVFPLAYALKALRKRARNAIFNISMYAIVLQSYIALLWFPEEHYKRLYNSFGFQNTRSIWNFQSSYIDLHSLLPSFIDFDIYTKLLQNYIVVALCGLLIVTGLVMHAVMPSLPRSRG